MRDGDRYRYRYSIDVATTLVVCSNWHAWNTLTIGIGLGVPVLIAMGLGWLFVLQSSERKRILELLHLTRSKLRRS